MIALFDKSTKIGIEFDMLQPKFEMETSANGPMTTVGPGGHAHVHSPNMVKS